MNTSRQAAGVGFTNFRDDPVTVTLMIYGRERGNRFDMDILMSGQKKERLPIAMTKEDLHELNQLLRRRMNKVILNYINKKHLNKEDLTADLAALANMGKFAFGEVFSDPQAQRAMLDSRGHERSALTIDHPGDDMFHSPEFIKRWRSR